MFGRLRITKAQIAEWKIVDFEYIGIKSNRYSYGTSPVWRFSIIGPGDLKYSRNGNEAGWRDPTIDIYCKNAKEAERTAKMYLREAIKGYYEKKAHEASGKKEIGL